MILPKHIENNELFLGERLKNDTFRYLRDILKEEGTER